jgi:DNA-binding NarL/FixJ family response regulator
MRALLLTSDLICSSQVAGGAARTGVELATASTADGLLDLAAAKTADLVILDLNTEGYDPRELVPQLRALRPSPRSIIAFGPHVHEARLAIAIAAGCDAVLPRGQFYARLDELLSSRGG